MKDVFQKKHSATNLYRQIRSPFEPPVIRNRRFRSQPLRGQGTRGTLPTNTMLEFCLRVPVRGKDGGARLA